MKFLCIWLCVVMWFACGSDVYGYLGGFKRFWFYGDCFHVYCLLKTLSNLGCFTYYYGWILNDVFVGWNWIIFGIFSMFMFIFHVLVWLKIERFGTIFHVILFGFLKFCGYLILVLAIYFFVFNSKRWGLSNLLYFHGVPAPVQAHEIFEKFLKN